MATKDPYNDEIILLQQLKEGNERAFETLYNTYSKSLLWKLTRMLKDLNQSEELLQELFVKVWERRGQINVEQPFPGYLYRIAQNMVADYYRKLARELTSHKQIQTDSTEVVNTTENAIFSNETKNMLNKAIALLPEQRRKAFILCKLEGKTHQEAAAIMNISPNTVHNHLVKGTNNIRLFLEKTENPPILLGLLMLAYLI